MIQDYLNPLPFIAVLRGVLPDEVVPIGYALVEAGFRIIEVPLNSPQPSLSIRRLSDALGKECLTGAGTVMTQEQVLQVAEAGGRLIVMPHSDAAVVRASKAAGLYCAPGVATPTEGFAALDNGADALKLFPAEQLGPAVVKAWRAVFPREAALLPVGGITPKNLADYWDAGANGFGLGSALFKPGMSLEEVTANARAFASAATALPRRLSNPAHGR
jgi:2-dehydro-3-deoxyphosphogalactonate aldolase